MIFQSASWGWFGKMPTFESLEKPDTNLATQLLSADGEILGKLYLNDNRTPIKYKNIPEHTVNALIATEDARYHEHSGIDVRGTLRAVAFLGKGELQPYLSNWQDSSS